MSKRFFFGYMIIKQATVMQATIPPDIALYLKSIVGINCILYTFNKQIDIFRLHICMRTDNLAAVGFDMTCTLTNTHLAIFETVHANRNRGGQFEAIFRV